MTFDKTPSSSLSVLPYSVSCTGGLRKLDGPLFYSCAFLGELSYCVGYLTGPCAWKREVSDGGTGGTGSKTESG